MIIWYWEIMLIFWEIFWILVLCVDVINIVLSYWKLWSCMDYINDLIKLFIVILLYYERLRLVLVIVVKLNYYRYIVLCF